MSASDGEQHRKAVIGNDSSFWLYSSRDGFDLTHPATPESPPIKPRVTLTTTSVPITIDPAKSALVVIDMQNFFLSPALGRKLGAGHKAAQQLASFAIPAARKAGIRILWVNWGLTDQDIHDMPPAIKRCFGFEAVPEHEPLRSAGFAVDRQGAPKAPNTTNVLDKGKDVRIYKGLGADCGTVKDLETGRDIHAGKLLMRDQWNTALYPPLDKLYEEGRSSGERPDVWIHKDRMSALWGARSDLQDYLQQEGIRTLLFSGVNTDQCVGGTLQDAFSKGYDCILLSDGAATSSPDFAQQCMEFNSARSWGFVSSCEELAKAVSQ